MPVPATSGAAYGRRYTRSEIRERRRTMTQHIALTRRRIAALARMEEGIAELEQAERELEAIPEPCGTGWPG